MSYLPYQSQTFFSPSILLNIHRKGQVSSRAEERQLRCPEEEYSERQVIRSSSHITQVKGQRADVQDLSHFRRRRYQRDRCPPFTRLQRRKYSPVQARQNPGHSPSTAFLALDAPPRSSPSCFELSTCTGSLRCRVLNCPLTCYSIHVQHIRP